MRPAAYGFPRMPFGGSPVCEKKPSRQLNIDTLYFLGHGRRRREVAARNFVLNIGHLGWREPVVQPATSKDRR